LNAVRPRMDAVRPAWPPKAVREPGPGGFGGAGRSGFEILPQSVRYAPMRGVLIILVAAVTACDGGPCGGPPPSPGLPASHVLLNPDEPALKQVPPDSFDVRFSTTQGEVVVRVYRDWAPMGAYRFYNLARNGFYDGSSFFRVLPGFAAQFGMNGRPEVDRLWSDLAIPDDPPRVSNRTGTLTYARAGPDSRTTQLFFNYADNVALDEQGFAPIGRVISGMGALYRLHAGYGETQPQGRGPAFACILSHGNSYLDRRYPRLDRVESVGIIEHDSR
jgi:peptidyl-prolyl cis-trans isomerase A (cyclophilin A)